MKEEKKSFWIGVYRVVSSSLILYEFIDIPSKLLKSESIDLMPKALEFGAIAWLMLAKKLTKDKSGG